MSKDIYSCLFGLIFYVSFVVCSIKEGPDAQCFHFLSASNGIIKTPNYPEVYPASFTCVWTITVDHAYYVQLTFHDFDIEDYEQCKADVLEIKDGGSKNAPLIGGQYCNSNKPPSVVTSSDNQLRLWFLSDKTKHYRGFNASYRAIKDEACGGVIDQAYGILSTPRYPFLYPCSRKCEWILKAPQDKFVVVEFDFFELETSCSDKKKCKCLDKLKVHDGKVSSTYCETCPHTIYSNRNEMKLTFTSDLYGRLRGFHAIYSHSSTPGCGKDIYAENGIIESPFFSEDPISNYLPYTYCIWRIITSQSKYLSLSFEAFDIHPSADGSCLADSLEIRDGLERSDELIGYYCNSLYNNITVSSKHQLYLRFRSDGKGNGRGFQIIFNSHSKDCHSSLGMEDRRIHDYQLYASSMLHANSPLGSLHPKYARLHGSKAWCSQVRPDGIEGEYIAVYFQEEIFLTKIVTQGFDMDGESYYVTSFKLEYEKDGNYHVPYASRNDQEVQQKHTIFQANKNSKTLSANTFDPPVITNRLTIIPLTYQSGKIKTVCMRFELFGCKEKDAP